MLPGFPKNVVKKKVKRGCYRLLRDDGYEVTATRGERRWLLSAGSPVSTLAHAILNLKNGYTAHDQLKGKASIARYNVQFSLEDSVEVNLPERATERQIEQAARAAIFDELRKSRGCPYEVNIGRCEGAGSTTFTACRSPAR